MSAEMTSVANLFLGFCSSSNGGRYPSQPFVIIQKTNTIATNPAATILQNHAMNFFLKALLSDTCFLVSLFCFVSIVCMLDCLFIKISRKGTTKKANTQAKHTKVCIHSSFYHIKRSMYRKKRAATWQPSRLSLSDRSDIYRTCRTHSDYYQPGF